MAQRRLTKNRVLKAALRYVDRHGLDHLSMRRLGHELGVGTMSLYTYVPDKGALLDGIVGLLLADVRVGVPDIEDWAGTLKDVARELRRVIRAHPNVLPLVTTRLPPTPEALALTEYSCQALRFAGFDEETTAHAHRLLTGYVIGYLSLELGGFFGNTGGNGGLPEDVDVLLQFPRVTECAPHLFDWDPEPEFEAGLDIIVSGLDSRLAAKARHRID